MSDATDKKRLRTVATLLKEELAHRARGTRINLRPKLRRAQTNTDGWRFVLGSVKGRGLRLEIWLDRYAKGKQRRFWFCVYSGQKEKLLLAIKKVPKYLKPIRTLTVNDVMETGGRDSWIMDLPLKQKEFSRPIYENYENSKEYFLGKYDPSAQLNKRTMRLIVRRATAFYEDIVRALPQNKMADRDRDIYPRWENRRVVRQHVSRERDSALAEERKIQDGYRCQVCKMTFVELYGDIGNEFAEAHHLVPLSRLKKEVQSSLEDLTTVCSNCHRMLHKLDGKLTDIGTLKKMLHRRQRR